MKCDCCGRKKKLFESFAEVKDGKITLYLCVDCNDLFYKLRDAASEDNKQEFDRVIADLENKTKKSSVALKNWAIRIIVEQKVRLGSPSDEGDACEETDTERCSKSVRAPFQRS